MTIDLKKGEKLAVGLSKLIVGLGWDPAHDNEHPFDLDITAFLLNKQGKLISEKHLIFYNNAASPDNAIVHSGDDTTGQKTHGGEDEILIIDLEKIDPIVCKIVFLVTLDGAAQLQQHFGQVTNSFIRIRNANNQEEIAQYKLKENYSNATALEAACLIRENNTWHFEALGQGYLEELGYFVKKYYEGVVIY